MKGSLFPETEASGARHQYKAQTLRSTLEITGID